MPFDYHNIGGSITPVAGVNPVSIAANSTAANGVAQTGSAIDRHTYNNPLSCTLVVPYTGSLAAGEKATLEVQISESTSSTGTYTSYSNTSSVIGSTSSTASQTPSGVVALDVDLGAADRYLKGSITATISGTTTASTVIFGESIIFGGANASPE